MLSPLGDPYTRLLRPDDYTVMKASNQGSVSGVGLQLAHGSDDGRVVVIAPLKLTCRRSRGGERDCRLGGQW